MDAENGMREASYNLRGEVAKEWQYVANNSGGTDAIVRIYQFDKIGRQTGLVEPARLGTITQVVTNTYTYHAFGAITAKHGDGTQREYFDYDQSGRIWRTNSEDGVDKVLLYDLLGNRTAEIRSQNVNLKTGV